MFALRRIRGALSIGLLWGVTWAACGVALGAWRIRLVGRFMFTGVTVLGVCGFVAGVAFAIALSRAERHRNVSSLSSRRSAAWGAVGGAVAGLVATLVLGAFSMPIVAIGAGIMGTVGSVAAVATVRVAQGGAASTSHARLDDPDIDRLTNGRGPT